MNRKEAVCNSPLSLSRSCRLLSISRSSLYYKPKNCGFSTEIKKQIDTIYLEDPTRGTRRISVALRNVGFDVGRFKIRRLMKNMGLSAIYCKPNLSKPHPQHKIYPYLLRGIKANKANHIWSADITYIRLKKGFVYLIAVIDWYSRCVLSWRLSLTLEAQPCVDTLNVAIEKYGVPEIFNTDQGSQFTSEDFTAVLKKNDIKISMDGKGRAIDNVFIERLWRTVKYENIILNAYESVSECRAGLSDFFVRYNTKREHQALGYKYPMEVYMKNIKSLDKTDRQILFYEQNKISP